jgi:hypothetical protein
MSHWAMERLIDKILMSIGASSFGKMKPGEFLKYMMRNHMNNEEREMLKNSTSKDWNHRPY